MSVTEETPLRIPNMDELKACDDRARQNVGHPEVLSWRLRAEDPTYLLTVTYSANRTMATWILHAGDGQDAAVVWIAMTTNLNEIYAKLKKAMNETTGNVLADVIRTTGANRRTKEHNLSDMPTAVFSKGALFADRFEILSHVGQGGMGVIYKARVKGTDEIVALKILHAHLVTDAVSRARFEQEAAKSELSHRNVIRIHQHGFSKNGQPFLSMDFLDGCPLTDLLQKGPLSLEDFTTVFTQVCEGLNYAHSQGVVHRDIKPGNIMICRTGDGNATVKIVDFGIAKTHFTGAGARLTPTGDVLGSPLYMSPEQCAGGAPDPRSDIYSIGCVMYEAVTGRVPFSDPNPIKVILMQLSERPQSFQEAVPGMSFPLEQERIVLKCLEKDPARRYQSAEELGGDLWKLTVTGSSGAVYSFAGDLRKPGGSAAPVRADGAVAPGAAEIVDAIKYVGKGTKMVTLRFRKLRSTADKDLIMQAVNLAMRLLSKGADLCIFLDYEAVNLAHRANLMSPEFHTDLATTDKISTIQAGLQKIMKNGGSVMVCEKWARYCGMMGGGPSSWLPGVEMLKEDQVADLIMERAGSFMDYT